MLRENLCLCDLSQGLTSIQKHQGVQPDTTRSNDSLGSARAKLRWSGQAASFFLMFSMTWFCASLVLPGRCLWHLPPLREHPARHEEAMEDGCCFPVVSQEREWMELRQ